MNKDRCEIIEKRSLYSKHFLNKDNTFTAEIHDEPIHYKCTKIIDDLGAQKKITIEEYKDIKLDLAEEINWETAYSVKENTFKSYFHDSKNNNPILSSFEIDNKNGDKRWINLKPLNANPSSKEIKNNKIVYKNAYQDTDIEYIVESIKIKENIIIHKPLKKYEFTFTIKNSEDVRPELKENIISFYDTKTEELLWVLEEPFIQDASGQIKYCAKYSMNKIISDGIDYKSLSIKIEEEEIEDLIFPLTLDPTTSPIVGNTRGFVERKGSAYPPSGTITTGASVNVGKSDLSAYGFTDKYYNTIGLSKFNVSEIPANSTINSATLNSEASGIYNTDNRFLRAQWYHYSSITTSAYIDLVPDSTNSVWMANSTLNSGTYTVSLSSPEEIATRRNAGHSEVGIRWGMSGGVPTGVNMATLNNPSLVVNYTPPAGPPIPTGLSASNSYEKQIRLTWNASSGATSYTLQARVPGGLFVTIYNGTNRSFYFTGDYTLLYDFRVGATGSGISSEYSSIISQRVRPRSPTMLSTTNIASTTATFRVDSNRLFNNEYDRLRFYYKRTTDSSWLQTNLLPNGTKTFNVTGLHASSSYQVRAQTVHSGFTSMGIGAGESTKFDTFNTTAAVILPSIPSAPVGSTDNNIPPRIDAGLNIEWSSSANSTLYDVRYVESGTALEKTHISGTKTSLTGLKYGTTYSLSVRGRNSNGVSDWSGSNNMTTAPKIPTVSSVLHAADNRVDITISGMSGGVSYYKIWIKRTTDSVWMDIQVSTTGATYQTVQIAGLETGVTYEFKVSSFYVVGGIDLESLNDSGNIGYSPSLFHTISVPSYEGGLKVYIGGQWVLKPLKRWNGLEWVAHKLKRWNGSSWV